MPQQQTTTPAPKRRWLRFSLRTLFVVVTVFAALVAIVVYELAWIRQRREFIKVEKLSQQQRGVSFVVVYTYPTDQQPSAPSLLWAFGESGTAGLYVLGDEIGSNKCTARDRARLNQAKRLFPEASVYLTNEYHDPSLGQSVYQGTAVP